MRVVVDGLPYPIVLTDGAPQETGALAASQAKRVIVISDRSVSSRGEATAAALLHAGCEVLAVRAVEAGERRKQWRSVADLHAAFIEAGLDRASLVVGVGGGTLTDVVGFAAATFMRGIRWLAVPTTVLGMVDAAIGGKTSVDRPEGKNLIGSVWQPVGVVVDLTALETLPAPQKRAGMAEVVKAAIVGDGALLETVFEHDLASAPGAWAHIIARAAKVKARVVATDPDDRGPRAVLNLGHTFAHAIEQASKYRVAHGAAVALGLRAAGILARDRTGWTNADHNLVLRALRRSGLRVALGKLSPDTVVDAMRTDKKRRNGLLQFVLPVRLGEVHSGIEVGADAVRVALETLTTHPGRGAW